MNETDKKLKQLLIKVRNGALITPIIEEIKEMFETQREEINQDINSVLAMLDGSTEKGKIANYIRKYILKI